MTFLDALWILVLLCILAWLVFCTLVAWNGISLYALGDVTKELPLTQIAEMPRLTVIIPACNEADTIEDALQSLRQSTYPNLDIILINDRSTDETGAIINRLARQDKRIFSFHVTELPIDWLGKVHALHLATQYAKGDFLLYTDADVHFHPDTLSRAVAYMQAHALDHLTVLPEIRPSSSSVLSQNLVSIVIAGFAALFLYGLRLRNVRKPDSTAFVGVGAFNMVRRSAFDKTRGWAWLKMEVIDDVGLGKMMKESGGKSDALNGVGFIHLEWYSDLLALIRGFEKNFFAGIGQYSWKILLWRTLQLATLVFLPYLAAYWVFKISGSAFLLGMILIVHWIIPAVFALPFRKIMPVKPYLLGFLPLGFVIIIGIMLRSAWVVTRKGGIYWRGTFYSLSSLRGEKRVTL